MRTHYDNLRIPKESTPAEIKSAYRKIVLQHHPDKSSSVSSKAIFLAATESYGILSDPVKRKSYDATLDVLAGPKARPSKEQAPKSQPPKPQSPKKQPSAPSQSQAKAATPQAPKTPTEPTIPQQLAELQRIYGRGQLADAERLAQQILNRSPREAVPYAVLGDMAKSRGDLNEAGRMYAFAAQFAPSNPSYQRRYEELLDRTSMRAEHGKLSLEASPFKSGAPLVGAGVVMAAGSYLVFSNEAPIAPGLKLISSWSLGLLVMLFLSGVVVGTSLSVGNLLERFQMAATTSTGRMGPTLALGIVAMVNFWAAAGLYLVLGFSQRAFNQTTTRFVAGVSVATLILSAASAVSHTLDGWQTFYWGGNTVFVGAICGWMVSDAFRA